MSARDVIAAEKAKGRAAVADYIAIFGNEVSIVDLRVFVRGKTGINFGGPTLAAFLKSLGHVRFGVRRIDTCPGKSTIYVPGPVA